MFKHGKTMVAVVLAAGLLTAGNAWAHCDTMDGPVISAAKKALDSGDINLVLVWVQPKDEAGIRAEFARARQARAAGGAARQAADHSFYEAFVRIHRAGEGAPYTGVKPAGSEVNPAVLAADRALATRSVEPVKAVLSKAVQDGIDQKYRTAQQASAYRTDDVAAGRAYVRSYVEFTHYAEGLYDKATAVGGHHGEGGAGHAAGHEGHGAGTAADPHAGHGAGAVADPHAAGHAGHGAGVTDEAHVGGHEAHGAGASGEVHAGHAGHLGHLPWLIAVVLGLVAVAQTAWIARLRRRA